VSARNDDRNDSAIASNAADLASVPRPSRAKRRSSTRRFLTSNSRSTKPPASSLTHSTARA
jgi:hypothetical protein